MRYLLRVIILLAALGAASALLTAQTDSLGTPRRVLLTGAAPDRAQELEAVLALQRSASEDSIATRVRQWYAAQGFLHAEAAIAAAGDSVWLLQVAEGSAAIVGRLDIDGLSESEMGSLRNVLLLRPGGPFRPDLLDHDIAAILGHVERTGRLLATVEITSFDDVDEGTACRVNLGLRIVPGPTLTIGAIRTVGNSTTTASTVRRASGLEVGDLWTPRAAAEAVRRLQRSRLFAAVEEPTVALDEEQQIVVTLPVTEGRHSSFDGMIGYLPPAAGKSAGTVTGLVDLRLGNLLGTARRLSLRWFQERQGTQEIDVTYREPWVVGSEIDVDLEFHQRKQDSLFVLQQFGIGAGGSVDASITVGGSFRQSTTTPIEGYGAAVLAASEQRLFGLQFTYDTRDDAVTPRSGAWYSADLQTGRKRTSGLGIATSASMQRLRGDLCIAFSPFRTQTVLVEAHGIDVRTASIDAADLVRLGGATSLRGYREGEFLGSRLAWGTLEHRFFFTPRSFIGVFVDGGFIGRPDLPTFGLGSSELVRFGYGITLRVEAPVGLLGISIALGKGDGFGDAKLHVRIQSEF